MPATHETTLASDVALLDLLTGEEAPSRKIARIKRRDEDLDPLLFGVVASYNNVSRNHYCHDLFPAHSASLDPAFTPKEASQSKTRLTYVSRQAPRRERLLANPDGAPCPQLVPAPSISVASSSATSPASSLPVTPSASTEDLPVILETPPPSRPDVDVQCMARTRIPTPHGPAFLHLYHNNRDNKEHLAIVVDHSQLSSDGVSAGAPPIRSRTLDAVWSDDETEMDRITRGAYVGQLSPDGAVASAPVSDSEAATPATLVRIHSECFTGETIGSQRCDCGEQLDEALRVLSSAGRGAVVYLRQEGRGIGLLEKIRAYNLQDLGHDTVSANLALGHGADERRYELAGAILRDLGLGDGVRLLTNNPDKVRALADEDVSVVERVPMVPRSWQGEADVHSERTAASTVVGGGAVHGHDLDKYLRTKISRMGHMLSLPGAGVY